MLLTKWICAHLLGDFLLQNRKMVRHKQQFKARSWMLYLHAFVHGLLFYLFTASWGAWWMAIIVSVSHFFIDWWKLTKKESTGIFIADQSLHILVLTILWFYSQMNGPLFVSWINSALNNKTMWAVLMGYFLLMWPFSMIIGLVTQRWRLDIISHLESQRSSLAEAGKWIGIFERLLVFTFIITNQFAGIGFLITAKSILRFSETKKESGRKEAEYILIGTLMSFAVAIITGLLVSVIIKTPSL
jgi:hypothetical protein